MPGTSGTSSSDSGSRHVCPTGAYCTARVTASFSGAHSPPIQGTGGVHGTAPGSHRLCRSATMVPAEDECRVARLASASPRAASELSARSCPSDRSSLGCPLAQRSSPRSCRLLEHPRNRGPHERTRHHYVYEPCPCMPHLGLITSIARASDTRLHCARHSHDDAAIRCPTEHRSRLLTPNRAKARSPIGPGSNPLNTEIPSCSFNAITCTGAIASCLEPSLDVDR